MDERELCALRDEFDRLYEARAQADARVACRALLEGAGEAFSAEFALSWRAARWEHFRGMVALEAKERAEARAAFRAGLGWASRSCDRARDEVAGAFWSGVCRIEAARLSGPLAPALALRRAEAEIEQAAGRDESFHFAGPLRVLGRITHLKPLVLGGSLDRAVAFYERALEIAPGNSTTLLYLADALLADRQPGRARVVLHQVLEAPDTHWQWEAARDRATASQWLESRFA